MNDTAIKNFCIWAREELRQQVIQQAARYGITTEGYADPQADVINGQVISSQQKRQRQQLVSSYLGGGENDYASRYDALIERAAYTWFNRFAAIRFMEVNGRLFSRVRMFSNADDDFEPQVLKEALEVDIQGVDQAHVAALLNDGDDEALFRYLFLVQCNELAEYMPQVFEPIGSAMELLLPQGLLRQGSVISRMVQDIPQEDWLEGVQIVGWMYQYYNAQLKDQVFEDFKKGKKASAESLKPATQLFTPDWIVRYLVENSLGRLWMQMHPASKLPDVMAYYIADESEGASIDEAVQLPSSPEDIAVVDPACGSGHILVYAFDLLGAIYEESGYMRRDIPQLILSKNLAGIEIDQRAAQWAAFALYMKGCEYDQRFLKRGVQPQITVLETVSFEEEELVLIPDLADRAKLLDAMAHVDECGSLFVPDEADMQTIKDCIRYLQQKSDLFAQKALEKAEQLLANCEPLYRTYDVVVANPPYMGGKNMSAWLSGWVKKNFPDTKGDLFSCFIERNLKFAADGGQLGFMTPYVWMFISTYEKLRQIIIDKTTITSMIQLEYSGFAGATVPICTFTLQKGKLPNYLGGYVRLSNFAGVDNQEPKALEAIKNPDCGWFYRRSADTFKSIPGSPIAYWASDASISAYETMASLESIARPHIGMMTGENDKYLRFWWEIPTNSIYFDCYNSQQSRHSEKKWYPCNKGGAFRKWYGNQEYVINWQHDGDDVINKASLENRKVMNLPEEFKFKPNVSWSMLSSSVIAFRYYPQGYIYEHAASGIIGSDETLLKIAGFCNSSTCSYFLEMVSPTLNFNVNCIAELPMDDIENEANLKLPKENISLARDDYSSYEASWSFQRHSMV